jgi:hypothetical protein
MIELLVALVILVLATGVCFMTFQAVSKAWQRGTALADDLSHGDFIMEQLAASLRSAYYPDSASAPAYGFWLEDNGDGEYASDAISWVKIGPALVGRDDPVVSAPHRVRVSLASDGDSGPAIAVQVWRPVGEPEDFDPEEVEPQILSKDVVGLDCRVATNAANGELEWLSAWEETNRLPSVVEVTLYLKPLSEGDEPVAFSRSVAIPVAPLSRR